MQFTVRLTFYLSLAVISGYGTASFANESGCVAPTFTYDVKSALTSCTELLKNEKLPNAEHARILTLRGRSLKVDGQLDAAINDFDAALALKPGDPAILQTRAWAAIDKGDFDRAEKIVKQLLSKNANDATAYNISATVAVLGKDFSEAKRLYDKAISLRPDDVLAHYNRLILYKLMGDYGAVIAEADAILALDNSDLDTLYMRLQKKRTTYRTLTRLERAQAIERTRSTDDAEKAYADWIAVDPGAVSYGYRAAFYWRRSHYKQALADLDKALADDPTFWPLHYTLGNVYLYTNRDEDAIRSFTQAIKFNPSSGVSFWRRAMAERRLHRDEAALRDALEAVEVDRNVRANKIERLAKLGYLQVGPNDKKDDPAHALTAAVQACMLDERCW